MFAWECNVCLLHGKGSSQPEGSNRENREDFLRDEYISYTFLMVHVRRKCPIIQSNRVNLQTALQVIRKFDTSVSDFSGIFF
jgi:hypothetical protein